MAPHFSKGIDLNEYVGLEEIGLLALSVSIFPFFSFICFFSLSLMASFPEYQKFLCCIVGALLGRWAPLSLTLLIPSLFPLYLSTPFSFLSFSHPLCVLSSFTLLLFLPVLRGRFSFSLMNGSYRDCSNAHSQSCIFHKHMGACKRRVR